MTGILSRSVRYPADAASRREEGTALVMSQRN
jgi:hypothetical protein